MADFQAHQAEFAQRHVDIIAASVDPLADAQELIGELGLTFPMGYGLNYDDVAEKTGAFYEIRRQILHATGFILKQEGTVAHAVYSTGPIGRLTVDDCLRMTAPK